jgi:hypothetical protein
MHQPVRLSSHSFFLKVVLGVALALTYSVSSTSAGMLTFTASGSGEAATASFVPETNVTIGSQTFNGILITLTNTGTGTNNYSDGTAVSGLQFTVSGGLGAPTALLQLNSSQLTLKSAGGKGKKYTPDTIKSYTSTGPFPGPESNKPIASHWGFNQSVNTISLGTVDFQNLGLTGSKPYDLITPLDTIGGYTFNSSVLQHSPSFNGSATFFLEDDSVNSKTVLSNSNINVRSINFGTGPDINTDITNNGQTSGPGPFITAAPAPPSAVLLALGGLSLAVLRVRSRRRQLAAAV